MPEPVVNNKPQTRANEFTGFPPTGHMNCPMCRYPLDGLPEENACPECGFEYDQETWVWNRPLSKSATAIYVVLMAIAVFFMMTLATLGLVLTGPWSTSSDRLSSFICVGITAFGLAFGIWGVRRRHSRPPQVCVTPRGISFRLHMTRSHFIEWDQIEHVLEHRFLVQTAIVSLKTGRMITLDSMYFENEARRCEFVSYAQRRLSSRNEVQ